jgi:hypothetical protein
MMRTAQRPGGTGLSHRRKQPTVMKSDDTQLNPCADNAQNVGTNSENKTEQQPTLKEIASENQIVEERIAQLRYDGASLSDGGTWGSVATILRSPHSGFGL